MPAADKFSELETKITRTVEVVRTARQERDRAEKELLSAKSQIKNLERDLELLRRERDLVKNKVESLLDNLSDLSEETLV